MLKDKIEKEFNDKKIIIKRIKIKIETQNKFSL
jgi:hypothetical protein